jgi:pyrroloquinoline quinone biosynthesis protein D
MSVQLVAASAIPKFERGVRLKHDIVRERHVVLGPEMLIELNQSGTAIMNQIDGSSSIIEIVDRLAQQFEIDPQDIAQDVAEFCTSMMLRRVLSI